MSPSFLDTIRASPPAEETICSIGFDPDLHTSGLGIVVGTISKPPVAEPKYKEVWAIIIHGMSEKLKMQDVQFADGMVSAVLDMFDKLPSLPIAVADKVITTIEGQRLYPKPNDTRQALVGKGNDLLRLAQISGSVQVRARMPPFDGSRVYQPEEWKGQQPKPTMHGDTAKRLGDIPAHFLVLGTNRTPIQREMRASELPQLPASMGHALDAVCLAEFGLDRYHDDRWQYRW